MKNNNEEAGDLSTLVKGELAAVQTYKQALEKVAGRESVGTELRRLETDHEEALSVLQGHMTSVNAEVPTDAGLWGEWSKAVEGTAKMFGDKAAIKALKEGEEHGVHIYEDALRNQTLDAQIRGIIRSKLLPKTKAHIPVLDRLLAVAGK